MNFAQYTQSLGSMQCLSHFTGRPACYGTFMPTVGILNTPEKFHEAIRLACLESRKGMLWISITERDTTPKMWLEELQQYDCTICESVSRHHGNYKCWFVCIPMDENT